MLENKKTSFLKNDATNKIKMHSMEVLCIFKIINHYWRRMIDIVCMIIRWLKQISRGGRILLESILLALYRKQIIIRGAAIA